MLVKNFVKLIYISYSMELLQWLKIPVCISQ